MTTIRKTIVLIALTFIIAAPVRAQVATSSLLPGLPVLQGTAIADQATGGIVTANPAAMQWAIFSEVTVGKGDGDQTHSSLGDASVKPRFYGLRWTGELFALGVDRMQSEVDYGPNDTRIVAGNSAAGVAAKPLGWLAVGASAESRRHREYSSSGAVTTASDHDTRTYGLSLNLGDAVYVGYAEGKNSFEDPSTSPLQQGKRDETVWGAAYRYVGDWKVRVEYDRFGHEPQEYDDGSGSWGAVNMGQGTVELGYGNFLVGYSGYEGSVNLLGSPYSLALDGSMVSLAFVPEAGPALSVRREKSTIKVQGFLKIEDELTMAALSWVW